MARLQSCGFELGDLAKEVDTVNGTPCTIDSTTKRSGSYSLKVLPSTSNGYVSINLPTATMDSGTETLYCRFYLYIVTAPSANTYIFKFHSALDNTYGVFLRLNTDRTMGLYNVNDGSQEGSSSSALSTNTWYRIEVSLGWDNLSTFQIDGSAVVSGATVNLVDQNVQCRFGVGVNGTNVTSGEWYIDDIAINDKTGTAQTSFPGAGNIVHMHLSAAGDDAPGGSGSWDSADEVPPSDADFYVHAADNDIADFNCESSSNAGIGASDTITLVQVGARVAGATATSCSYNPRIKSQASGTTTNGTTTTIANASANTHDDTASSKQYKLTSYTDPQAGGAWTPSLLDSMQIGTRAPDATPDMNVYNCWALVELVPAAGGATVRPRSLLTMGAGS